MAKRPKPCLIELNLELSALVLERLELKCSPEQISGSLKKSKHRQKTMQISAETIYKTTYFRKRTALNHLLAKHLRRGHNLRHSKLHARKGERGTINIVNGVSIHDIPDKSILDVPLATGSGDLVSGSKNTHIATLFDRESRYTIILKLKGKDAASVTHALTEKFNELPNELGRTLTKDRGIELAKHTEFTASTDMPVYFCDPQSPWPRGTNENTNSLIRQYLPKKTCLAHILKRYSIRSPMNSMIVRGKH